MNGASKGVEEVLNNKELRSLISCIGMGVSEYYDTSKVRYGKVILAADQDPDGCNIASILMGTIAAHMPFLLEEGMLYLGLTPLYKQDGKWFYEFERDKVDFSRPLFRYKG